MPTPVMPRMPRANKSAPTSGSRRANGAASAAPPGNLPAGWPEPRLPGSSHQPSRDPHRYNHQHAPEQHPGGVAANIARLHEPQYAAHAARPRANAVHDAVDELRVGKLP